jgi:hypothetical protein
VDPVELLAPWPVLLVLAYTPLEWDLVGVLLVFEVPVLVSFAFVPCFVRKDLHFGNLVSLESLYHHDFLFSALQVDKIQRV